MSNPVDSDQNTHTEDDGPKKMRPYTWYALILMMTIYTVSLLDRKLPFILVESIKEDLSLSDTQVGLISGLVFTLTYSIAGIPVARLADRVVRKHVITVSLIVWSILTTMGGFAQNFWQLAAARMGVAIGESGATPAAHSIIGDMVPKSRRAFAIGVYMTGAPIGILIGLSLGGIINDLANWRIAMIVLGAPGLLLSVLVLFTLKEPLRRHLSEPAAQASKAEKPKKGLVFLFSQPAFRQMFIGGVIFTTSTGAMLAFTPAFIMRTYDMSSSQTGLTYGILAGLSGAVGALGGGALNDRLQKWDTRAGLWLVAACLALSAPLLALAYSGPGYILFLALLFIPQATGMVYAGPSFSAIQTLFESRLHAFATAVFLFGLNGVGLSLGPLIAGAVSDILSAMGKADSLQTALFVLAFGKLWAAVHYLLAASAFKKSVAAQARADDAPIDATAC